ncbi:MAG: AGE family epimerase/isomerase [Chloroflexota bacterium]|nr:AGE family epimerase/isomerase [Chloroflexota bacterium]
MLPIDVRFVDLLAIYRAELLQRVVPFWLDHAIDHEYGGILTCIGDDGRILSRDKYMWSQLRAIWTFSALFNRIEANAGWLDVARHIFDFAKRYGRDDQGRWVFAVDKEGNILQDANSIYADGFAIYGLTEYARATGDQEAIDLALATYDNVQRRLAVPGSYQTEPYPLPEGVKAHGVSMIFSLVFFELACLLDDKAILTAALYHAGQVLDVYRRPERRQLFEFTRLDGSLIDSPQGRAIVPGHAIESMWFMVHIFRELGDEQRIRQAIECIKWHVELGWDEEQGGLLLARDAAGSEPWWAFADSKLWWPHTEALYALLLAHEHSGEGWCLDWYRQVHNYSFSHFPVRKYGEWTQKLDRQGRPFAETVALPVKDPFHLPRALIYGVDVLERLAAAQMSSVNGSPITDS